MSYTSPSGKVYKLVPAAADRKHICDGCAFEPADSDCFASGDCTGALLGGRDTMSVYVEDVPGDDFLSGSKACDLSGEGPCEGCQ